MTSVGTKIARGAAWMIGARIADRIFGLASTVILARLLTPADFGLVAMAMSVIALIDLATAFGFEVSLLRAAQPTREQYDTVWTLNLIFGLSCASVTAAVALPAADFYGDGRLGPVMFLLALGWAISSVSNVGIVDFRRNLQFDKEFRLMMTTRVVMLCVTIPMAFIYRNYWGLIAGMLTGRIVNVVLSYWMHPYRPRPCLQASRELFSFSVWILLEKIATFGNARTPDFILGRTHGPAAVGIYRMAEEIGYLPGSEIVAPINRVAMPGAARHVEAGGSMTHFVTATTGILFIVLIPACIGISVVAGSIVELMLGEQWIESIPILQIMAVNALIVALWSNQYTALMAAGLPRLTALVSLFRFAIFAPVLFILTPTYGGVGVAVAVLLSSAVSIPIGMFVSFLKLSVRPLDYLVVLVRPLAATFVMVAAVLFTRASLESEFLLGPAATLVVEVAVGVVSYVLAVAALFVVAGRPEGAESWLLSRMRDVIAGALRRRSRVG